MTSLRSLPLALLLTFLPSAAWAASTPILEYAETAATRINTTGERMRQQAEKGDAEAQYLLGLAYVVGLGTTVKNDAEGFKWMRKAAVQGHLEAQLLLGELHASGQGTPVNRNEAYHWYSKAAQKGLPSAEYALYRMLMHGDGVAKNEKEALRWLEKSAANGWAEAQYRLGRHYIGGLGVPEDIVEGGTWFSKAADQDHAAAQGALGLLLMIAGYETQDFAPALELLNRGAAQGDIQAQSLLGTAYASGLGVPKDPIASCMWLILASTGPSDAEGAPYQKRAQESLGNLRGQLTSAQVDEAERNAETWRTERRKAQGFNLR